MLAAHIQGDDRTNGYCAALEVARLHLVWLSGEGHNEFIISDLMAYLTEQRKTFVGESSDRAAGARVGFADLEEKLYNHLESNMSHHVYGSNGEDGLKRAAISAFVTTLHSMRERRIKNSKARQ